jgi:hypothetical protein
MALPPIKIKELIGLLGSHPKPELLAHLKATRVIYNYWYDSDWIKVQPFHPIEWIEKTPEMDVWIYRTI